MVMEYVDAIMEGKKEACKTYIEQTKLLVTLSSAFLFAPAGLVAILKDTAQAGIGQWGIRWFIIAELLFVGSVLMGYVVLGTLAGSQNSNSFDVFRTATRVTFLMQFFFYIFGLLVFMLLGVSLIS
jgi:hypothetical protein